MSDDLAARRARHQLTRCSECSVMQCSTCGHDTENPEGCDAAVAFAELENEREWRERFQDTVASLTIQVDRERERRLAAEEALEEERRFRENIQPSREWQAARLEEERQARQAAEQEAARLREDLERALKVMAHTGGSLAAEQEARQAAEQERDELRDSLPPGSMTRNFMQSLLQEQAARARMAEQRAERLAALLLALEWRPAKTMAGSANLFCPVCGGCQSSAARNPRTQRPDGHRSGQYIYEGTTHDGCAMAAACDEARQALAEGQS